MYVCHRASTSFLCGDMLLPVARLPGRQAARALLWAVGAYILQLYSGAYINCLHLF